ncbi:MAG: pitrilysin family protein [Propionibacteriaceae bacterium]|nr:pitrilysin family protein [Propionibacteriaceae bacterium]
MVEHLPEVAGGVSAQAGSGEPDQIRRTTLPGGLRVVSEVVPGSRSFSVGFFVNTGSRHEAPHLHGVSHFLEHVLFKGTKRRRPEEISAAIERVGGDINAYTAKEHTCFYAQVLHDDRRIAVDVLTDMLGSSLVRSVDVDSEREVILDEIAMHNDDPTDVAHELVTSRLFAGSPLERSVIGSKASIEALERRQIASYWRRHYRGPAIVVAAAGRVDHDRLAEALVPFAEQIAASTPAPRLPSGHSRRGESAVLLHRRPLEHSQAVLGFRSPGLFSAPGEFDRTRAALNLLAMILGGGMSSRLFVEVREHRGLAYSIDAGEMAYTDAGCVTIEWGSAPERVPEIAAIVRDTIADVITDGVTPDELARAKGQMTGQLLLGLEGSSARMSRIGLGELLGDYRTVDEVAEIYRAVTVTDLQRAAADGLGVRPVLAVVGARVSRPRLSTLVQRWL